MPNDADDKRAQMDRWNPAPVDMHIEVVSGGNPPEGDGRATAAFGNGSHLDPQLFDNDDYENMSVVEIKAEIASRNANRDSDNQLSKSGNKNELIAILEEDDDA